MPNDCWNTLTIEADETEFDTLIQTEFKDIPAEFFKIHQRGVRAVILSVWSAWFPDFEWLERLIVKYPSSWVKNEWIEEGGTAGVWVGKIHNNIRQVKSMEWDDMSVEQMACVFKKK